MPLRYLLLLIPCLLLAGCARFVPRAPVAPTTPTYSPVPTFTPTAAVVQPTPAAQNRADEPTVETASDASTAEAGVAEAENAPTDAATADNLLPTPTPDAPAPEAGDAADSATLTAEPGPRLVVIGELVNVRGGPGVDYPIVGATEAGAAFTPTGRNEAGDWWQVCCFGVEPGWLFGALVEVEAGGEVALVTDIPPAPTPAPVAADAPAQPTAESEAPPTAEAAPEVPPTAEAVPDAHSGTAGTFDPAAQYHVVGYRVIGYGENNGGLFNNGAQHIIFVNVIDANGNGIDGAVVKNAIDDNINVVTGPKGPGRAEFEMFWDPYKLYVASDPSGPVTSQVTNQMNTAYPHIPDIIGRLGPPEEEYAICPTVDDRCEPPFYHAHWSYEVTFQKVN